MTITRASLPETVNYNGQTFSLNVVESNKYNGVKQPNTVVVKVLPARLKHRLDLHGKPYKPSIFVFTPAKNN